MYQDLYNSQAARVLEVLFKYPEKEFSLSDLAKEAGVSKSIIGKILMRFYKAGLVDIVKLSKIWRIKASQQNPAYAMSKIARNLTLVYSSGVIGFLANHFKNPKTIILFGSFRKGDDISDSDVDIAIENDESKAYSVLRLAELDRFEKFIGRKIQVHLFNRKNVDINLFNNIANGVVLFGFLEVKP